MAGASNSVYEFDSVVRGQNVYKSVWTPLTDCGVVKLVSASWCRKTTNVINTL